MPENPCNCSCVVLSRDPVVVTSLTYLLSVILKCDVSAVTDPRDFVVGGGRNASLDVLFVYVDPSDQSAIDLVRAMRDLELSTIVIALLKDLPDMGARMYEAGADDVVHWPADLKEIALRLRHHMRESWSPGAEIDLAADWEAEAYITGRAGLTTAEAQILRVLMAKDGQIVSRDELSMAVDARPWRHGDRKFDVHMAKIRQKLSEAFGENVTVFTLRSRGYRLTTTGSMLFASLPE